MAPQTGFDVDESQVTSIGGKGGGKGCIRVPLHDDDRVVEACEMSIEQLGRASDLLPSAGTAGLKLGVGLGQTEIGMDERHQLW